MAPRINFVWLDGRGGKTGRVSPFIEVQFYRAELTSSVASTLALVDTGCVTSMITQSLAEAAGFSTVRFSKITGLGGEVDVAVYRTLAACASLPDIMLEMEMGTMTAGLLEDRCQAILGMDFLHFGILHLQPQSHDGYFEFLPPR